MDSSFHSLLVLLYGPRFGLGNTLAVEREQLRRKMYSLTQWIRVKVTALMSKRHGGHEYK